MSTRHAALALVATLAAAGCSRGIRVVTHHDPSAAALETTYQTWAWLPPPDGADERPAAATYGTLVREAVEDALADRTFQRVEPPASFLVGWHLTDDEPVPSALLNAYYGYTWGRWFPGGGVTFQGGYRAEVAAGTLVIDVVDGRARELIYRGLARVELHRLRDDAARRRVLAEVVPRMLERFPRR